jgi:Pentapeptide repeats (8 copies)
VASLRSQRYYRITGPLVAHSLRRVLPLRRVLWIVGIVVVVSLLIRAGYSYEWTGFGQSKVVVAPDVRPSKLKLLIVPAVLAIGGYLFTRSENRATQAAAERRAQDDALQAYLDSMSAMLVPEKDQPSLYDKSPPDSLRTVARARTLTVLGRLDGRHKRSVLQFLYESGLIAKDRPILDLGGASLSRANLDFAKLERANLSYAGLSNADLSDADLKNADLERADLSGTDLSNAELFQAKGWTEGQLTQARSLKGATMPNGQKYEDWLKGSGEDG